MLISRSVNLLNQISKHAKRKNMLITKQPTRLSHEWVYRQHGEPQRKWVILAEIAGGIVWWWVLYRLWYDHKHITGHWEFPDTSKWTDEELGIPPDDSD